MKRRALVAALGGLLLAAPARAEPTEGEKKAAAQALFDEAKKLAGDSDFAAACPKFAESLRLDPTMGTRFYLADCLEHVGRLASAWTYYLEVADAAKAAGAKDREKFASDRAAALKPRLPKIAVVVAAPVPGQEVKRDGIPLGEAQWGTPIPVDLGAHEIAAAAPRKKPWLLRIEAKQEGETLRVEVPALEDEPPPAPLPVIAPPVAAPPPPPPAPPSRAHLVAGASVGAAGLVGLVVGIVEGLTAIDRKTKSNAGGHCDQADRCDGTGLELRRAAIDAATGSTAGFIAGGVLLAGGTALVLSGPWGKPHAPVMAVGPQGLVLRGGW